MKYLVHLQKYINNSKAVTFTNAEIIHLKNIYYNERN